MPGVALLDLVFGHDTRDRGWMRKGLCRREHKGCPSSAWSCDEKTKVRIAGVMVPALRAHQMAADICFGCPAQWDCAKFAIEGPETVGVWAMTPRDMKKFVDLCKLRGIDSLAMLAAADSEDIPVQVMVRRLVDSV